MKKTLLFVVIVMIASMLLTAAAVQPKSQVWLYMMNRTDQLLAMQLKGYDNAGALMQNYYLTVKKFQNKTFWIDRNVYNRTTWACGFKNSGGYLISLHNTRLNFTPCWGVPANAGEPSMEKIRFYSYYTFKGGRITKITFLWPGPGLYDNDILTSWHWRY